MSCELNLKPSLIQILKSSICSISEKGGMKKPTNPGGFFHMPPLLDRFIIKRIVFVDSCIVLR